MAKVHCENCGWHGTDDDMDLREVPDLAERLDPGSEVPAGECPECGALVYLTKE